VQPPVTDQPDPVADLLDVGQHMGGQEHGAAVVDGLPDQVAELLLDQRVEPERGFVEDDQLRAVHEGLDEGHLLLVPVRQVLVLAVELKPEPLG